VIDEPGKCTFYATDLELVPHNPAIGTLIVCGVTIEVRVNTTLRETQDHGVECVAVSNPVASYSSEFHETPRAMVTSRGGLFGWVSDSKRVPAALGAG